MRGRKPTPTHLRLLRGNPARRPLLENEPKPGIPEKPEWLDADASAEGIASSRFYTKWGS